MLEKYEANYHAGMNIQAVAEEIYEYTSGYLELVSSVCRRIDEKILGKSGLEIRRLWKRWCRVYRRLDNFAEP